MYRILKNSIENFCESLSYNENDSRYRVFSFFRLLANIELYAQEKEVVSEQYKKLSSFLYCLRDHARCELILYELTMLGVEPKRFFDYDFTEETKIFNMFLDLAYWRD